DPTTVTLNVLASPQVKSVVINDGSAQRSLIRSLTVTFDMPVLLDPRALTLVRSNGSMPTLTQDVTLVNGETVVILTFSGARTSFGSLDDGLWTLTVHRSRVHRVENRGTIPIASRVDSFRRFFGDVNGDRTDDATDQAAFNSAFGNTDALSLAR